MKRLTTSGEYPHGAEGVSPDELTGNWYRGSFEATACVEKLSRYEDTGLEPEEIKQSVNMEALKELIEKRKAVGKKPSYTKGGDYNDFLEYGRLGDLIVEEVYRMYDAGKLS